MIRELFRPVGFFSRIGDQTLFYGGAIAGIPHARHPPAKRCGIAEISMGAVRWP